MEMLFEPYPETSSLSDFLQDCEVRNFSPRTIYSYKSNLKHLFLVLVRNFFPGPERFPHLYQGRKKICSLHDRKRLLILFFSITQNGKEYKKYNPNIQKNILDTAKNSVMKKGSLSAWGRCRP